MERYMALTLFVVGFLYASVGHGGGRARFQMATVRTLVSVVLIIACCKQLFFM